MASRFGSRMVPRWSQPVIRQGVGLTGVQSRVFQHPGSTAPVEEKSKDQDTRETLAAAQESLSKAQETLVKHVADKSQAELDEDLRLKLSERSGGGGEAGLELEDGQPVAMKRSVKVNMHRLI